MIINQRMIDFYGEDNLLHKLRTISFYRSWFGLGFVLCNKINRHKLDSININEIVHCDAIEQVIYKTIITRSNALSTSIIKQIADIYYAAFEKYPHIVYDSLLFNPNVASKIFNSQQLQKVKEYKDSYKHTAKNDLLRILGSPGNEINENLILFAEYQLLHNYEKDDPKKVVDSIFNYIMNNPDENNELYHKEFIARYTAYINTQELWQNDRKNTVNLYISDRDLSKNTSEVTQAKWNGCSYDNTGIVFLSREALNKGFTKVFSTTKNSNRLSHLSSIIAVSAHEVKHSSQAYKVQNGILDRCSFNYLLFQLFDTYYQDEYVKNYDHSEIETDANHYGFAFTRDLLRNRFPSKHNDFRVAEALATLTQYKQYAGTKILPGTNTRIPRERYNTKLLDAVVSKHPDACEKFPALKLIYSSEGKRHSFTDLLRIEKRIPTESKEILYDYFLTDIEDNFIADINLGSCNIEEQIMIVNKVLDVFVEEEQRMASTMRGYEFFSGKDLANLPEDSKKKIIDFRHNEFQCVNRHRAKVMKNCFEFLNKNKYIIDNLRSEAIRNGRPLSSFSFLPNIIRDLKLHVTDLKRYGIDAASDIAGILESLDSLEYTGKKNIV